jgi:multiple antibiotic resistance protein
MLNIAIYPVATPIIAGPGSILAIILLTDNNRFTVSEQATTLARLRGLAQFLIPRPLLINGLSGKVFTTAAELRCAVEAEAAN